MRMQHYGGWYLVLYPCVISLIIRKHDDFTKMHIL